MSEVPSIFNYTKLLGDVKKRVLKAQKEAIYAANSELLQLYWDIGKMLNKCQGQPGWNDDVLNRLSNDLKNAYPEEKGFSPRNCRFMMQFNREYPDGIGTVKPLVSQLPITSVSWSHNILLIQKVKDLQQRRWYMLETIKNGWSRRFLGEAISSKYYERSGALPNNFDSTLPTDQSKQVKEFLKDPYIFDMLTFTNDYNEKDVENGLVEHIQDFLISMGTGFAFMGHQYHLEIDGDDYYIDLLMYNAFLHRYVVIELKRGELKPEYVGKLNFYCSAVDDQLCREGDFQTIGLLLCQGKKRITAEYSLRGMTQPIGISDYKLGNILPSELKSTLPSIEEIENDLNENNDRNIF